MKLGMFTSGYQYYPLEAAFQDAKRKFLFKEKHAPLAQLVEQLTLNQWVHGSSP